MQVVQEILVHLKEIKALDSQHSSFYQTELVLFLINEVVYKQSFLDRKYKSLELLLLDTYYFLKLNRKDEDAKRLN